MKRFYFDTMPERKKGYGKKSFGNVDFIKGTHDDVCFALLDYIDKDIKIRVFIGVYGTAEDMGCVNTDILVGRDRNNDGPLRSVYPLAFENPSSGRLYTIDTGSIVKILYDRLLDVLDEIREVRRVIDDVLNGTVSESLKRMDVLKRLVANAEDRAAGLCDELCVKYRIYGQE